MSEENTEEKVEGAEVAPESTVAPEETPATEPEATPSEEVPA